MKRISMILCLCMVGAALSCHGGGTDLSALVDEIDSGAAPVLDPLAITSSVTASIALAAPTFSEEGSPAPEVSAYIGVNGAVHCAGPVVTGFLQGPVCLSGEGYLFTGLDARTVYRVIVAARNLFGVSVREIVQSTSAIAPVLGALAVTGPDESSVVLERPPLSIAGNPVPEVLAYIGHDGVIFASGQLVKNYARGPVNVYSEGCRFTGLTPSVYRIIVVAKNSAGYSVAQAVLCAGGAAPVLDDLAIEALDASSVTLARPTFAVAGNPPAAVSAYIGPEGSMALNDGSVSGYSQGPIDVSQAGCRFDGLASGAGYRVAVVARNAAGYSARETACSVPAVNLYFSEYIEGSSNNKALEIFNAGSCAVPLLGHVAVAMFANGSQTPGATCQCAGVLEPGAVYVIVNPRAVASVTEKADALHEVCGFNGNDALVLYYDGVPVDAIGQAGFNPGTEWLDGGLSTMNRTLRRKPGVARGDTSPWDAFILSEEWEGYPCDDFDDLGLHAR